MFPMKKPIRLMGMVFQIDSRQTLVATRRDSPGAPTWNLDIVMQGDNETVFFDI
jgi:protocatechuate 3,4-dioxygenase beta subunit